MYNKAHYWIRIMIASIVAIILNHRADIILNVQVNSGRDWLLFFAIYGVLFYFFVYKWAKKQIALWHEKEKTHHDEDT
jgi:uncharacterized membrane protein